EGDLAADGALERDAQVRPREKYFFEPEDPRPVLVQDGVSWDEKHELLKSPGGEITGKYSRIEPLSTRLVIHPHGDLLGASEAQRKKIEAERRLRGMPEDDLACRIDLIDRRILGAYAVRAARDTDARERAKREGVPNEREKVLSVFTAPEWTFKMPKKPLTKRQRDMVVDHYCKLSKGLKGMLIIPGSIVYNAGDERNPRIRNDAIAVFEGKVVKTVRKKHWGGDARGYAGMRQSHFEGAGEQDSCIFELEGLKFALEICADHVNRRAREEAGGYGVDVHIVVSDGVTVGKPGLAAHKGGIVIYNDAETIPDPRWAFTNHYREELRRPWTEDEMDNVGTGGNREVMFAEDYLRRLVRAVDGENLPPRAGDPIASEHFGELLAGAPIEIRRNV
ncbi:MAG TPA: hypothetical protein VIK91_08260, partial [Nannocystis sp.]